MSGGGRRVVVVTGASQGIGAAVVAGYRKLGWGVVANSRTIGVSDDPGVVTVAGDIAEVGTARAVIDAAVGEFGRVDTLVNNAGIFLAKPFTEYTAADYAAVMGVNVAGFFGVTQLAVERMLVQGGGHIVNVTTTLVEHALSAVPSVLASLSKGGLQAATKSLAIEYAGRGIRVNAVSPGVIQTPMHSAETHAALAGLHPVGRIGRVEDVVDGVLFLENAPFVTGEILHIDGGQSAGH
ncbi:MULTISPECIES: SDR family oxidoreductase [unclassified Crossiella]|uniref:SDR family NAD(P)-dependent oxidoreductase n=1 Tax=unclassified Crossiella TaxID=2620835 RepID=UPI0027E49AD0|nr:MULTISPECIES: SDR family oxidoreductase [unclassified Crossiella]